MPWSPFWLSQAPRAVSDVPVEIGVSVGVLGHPVSFCSRCQARRWWWERAWQSCGAWCTAHVNEDRPTATATVCRRHGSLETRGGAASLPWRPARRWLAGRACVVPAERAVRVRTHVTCCILHPPPVNLPTVNLRCGIEPWGDDAIHSNGLHFVVRARRKKRDAPDWGCRRPAPARAYSPQALGPE